MANCGEAVRGLWNMVEWPMVKQDILTVTHSDRYINTHTHTHTLVHKLEEYTLICAD